MSAPDEHLKFQYDELHKLDDALGAMRRLGILESNPAYQAVYRARGAALAKIGLNLPRTTSLLQVLAALSPGQIRLFQDAELGWLVEAIPFPNAQPIRKYVSDEVATAIIKGELTHELEEELMKPVEEYIA